VFVHGLILTLWFLAFALRAALVAWRRTALHRAVGWAGVVIGLAVVVSGGHGDALPDGRTRLAGAVGPDAGRPDYRVVEYREHRGVRHPACSGDCPATPAGDAQAADAARVDQHRPHSMAHKPMWSSDGRELLYVSRPEGFEAVRVRTHTTFGFGNPVPLTRTFNPGAPSFRALYDVTPDDRFVGLSEDLPLP
jgi:hypothetical protein